jgi:hypothetical protein
MKFYDQFLKFDPLNGFVPTHPFLQLPDIAWRARALLQDFSVEEIVAIAGSVDMLVEEFFENEKQKEIDRLYRIVTELSNDGFKTKEDEFDYLYYDLKNFEFIKDDSGKWVIDPDSDLAFAIPTVESTTEIDALKECGFMLDLFCEETIGELVVCKPYQLFAVLALWHIADAVNFIDPNSEYKKYGHLLSSVNKELFDSNISNYILNCTLAGKEALNAMEAVCYAEHLQEVGLIKKLHEIHINETHEEYLNEKFKQEEEDKKRKTERSKKMRKGLDQIRDDIRDLVISEWDKDSNKFNSADKAGIHFYKWLEDNGYKTYSPRKIAEWIRAAEKKKGKKYRYTPQPKRDI